MAETPEELEAYLQARRRNWPSDAVVLRKQEEQKAREESGALEAVDTRGGRSKGKGKGEGKGKGKGKAKGKGAEGKGEGKGKGKGKGKGGKGKGKPGDAGLAQAAAAAADTGDSGEVCATSGGG